MTALRRIPDEADNHAPEFYAAIRYEFDEIVMGMNVLLTKARDLTGAYQHRQTVSLSIAAGDMATVSGQISNLARHLQTVAAKHVEARK